MHTKEGVHIYVVVVSVRIEVIYLLKDTEDGIIGNFCTTAVFLHSKSQRRFFCSRRLRAHALSFFLPPRSP